MGYQEIFDIPYDVWVWLKSLFEKRAGITPIPFPRLIGIYAYFDKSATVDIKTPVKGKKLRVRSAFFSNDANITSILRFKATKHIILKLTVEGAVGMLFVAGDNKPHQGRIDEPVELYIDGTGNCTGWICYEEV